MMVMAVVGVIRALLLNVILALVILIVPRRAFAATTAVVNSSRSTAVAEAIVSRRHVGPLV